MIKAKHLVKTFRTPQGPLIAVDDISLSIEEGTTLGIVGESGCGKSTLGRLLLRLMDPTSGDVYFDGVNLASLSHHQRKKWRQQAQIIFQDPYASLDPRMTAEEIVEEPLIIHGMPRPRDLIVQAFEQAGLSTEHLHKYPHEFSGGQRQRIGIARALILKPRFIVCDEPITALDVSVQAQIVNLLKDLQQKLGLTYLFISHDLRMVSYLADEIAVMYLGKIVERAPAEEFFTNPRHPYTQALIASIPSPHPSDPCSRVLPGDIPSPTAPPSGCRFHTRCPYVMPICREKMPQLKAGKSASHSVACHLRAQEDEQSISDKKKPPSLD